jgi:adenylate cyclase
MPKRLFYYSAVFVVTLFFSLGIHRLGVLNKIEYILYDWRVQTLSSFHTPDLSIVLVSIDQPSLDWMQKEQGIGWPWPREMYGVLSAFAKESGAKAIVFDMLFSETSLYTTSDDEAFADALKTFPSVGAIVLNHDTHSKIEEPKTLVQPLTQNCTSSTTSYTNALLPVEALTHAFTMLGVVNASPDSDGVIRKARLCHTYKTRTLPSLALAAFQMLYPTQSMPFENEHIVRYFNAPFSYQTYSAASIIQSWIALQNGTEPTVLTHELHDKIIFVGLSASGLFDQRVSPLSQNHSGVDIQATIFNNLISNTFITSMHFGYQFLLMLLFGAFTTALMYKANQWWHFIPPLVLLPLCVVGIGYLFYYYGIWLHVTLLLSHLGSIVIVCGIVGFLLEGRQKRYIKKAFSHYVSPSVVEKLIEHPEQLKLGGESRVLSIFFSDIEGFTSLSEILEPERLIEMLHEYLESLSNLILEHNGTIDKYEGDAIIAFWNAPVDTPMHETLAVKAALACQEALKTLNPQFKEKYGVTLHTRIGIHTGKVIVGNLGSAKHFDYSFIGDAGNLAARLEGVNKVFGTDILVSQTTYENVHDVLFRHIATIKVVGRAQALNVYQPLAEGYNEENLILFQEALHFFEAMEYEKAKEHFANISEHDCVAARYLEIINDIMVKKLLWDDAIVLSTK